MKYKPLLFLFLISVLAGCYPGGAEFVEDADVVYTTYDVNYDFGAKSTFSMPDKIVIDIDIEDGDTTYEYMNDAAANDLLKAMKDNMEAYGWQYVEVDADPDLLLTPAALKNTTIYYSYWYDWWYGGYWGGWGWYYPPYYSVSSYTTGTLIMVIADPDQGTDSPVNRSKALWIAAANGLLVGNYDVNRATDAIDQAFRQSTYLNR